MLKTLEAQGTIQKPFNGNWGRNRFADPVYRVAARCSKPDCTSQQL